MPTQTEIRNGLLKNIRAILDAIPDTHRIPWALDNQSFDSSGKDVWVEVTIESTASIQRTLGRPGNRRYRREGILTLVVRTRAGIGIHRALDIAQQIRGRMEGKSIGGTNPIGGVLINEQGQDITGYNVAITYPFWFEERG